MLSKHMPRAAGLGNSFLDLGCRNSYNEGMKASVSEKGQVTIPKPLRDRLGIRPGQVLEFEAREGTLVARKASGTTDPVDAVYGILAPFDVDDEIDKMRGKPWNPEDDAPRANRR